MTDTADGENISYREMCFKIAQELTADDLKNIKFMLRDKIKASTAEKITDGKDMIKVLEKRDVFSVINVKPLEELLTSVNLQSLAGGVRNHREKFPRHNDTVNNSENYATYSMTIVQNFVETSNYRRMEELVNRKGAVLVKGPPGSGKSQNAFYYAQKFHKTHHDSVVWRVHCKSSREMHLSYANLMIRLRIREVIQYSEDNIKECINKMFERVYSQLTSDEYIKCKHLIIMDDMESPNEAKNVHDMMEYFIIAKNINVIGTSQSRFSPKLTHDYGLEINRMTDEEVIQLFRYENNLTEEDHITEIKELARKLDHLPLCLALASSYIRITKTSVANYNNNWSELQEQAHNLSNEGKNFEASYSLTLEKVRKDLSENAQKLLSYIPHFNYTLIPIQLLESLLESYSLPKEAEINQLLTALHDYSLATISGIGDCRIVSIHSVTVWFLEKTKPKEVSDDEKLFLLRHFCYHIDTDARLVETMKRNVRLLDHACCLLKRLESDDDSDLETQLFKCYLNCSVAVTFHLYGNTQVSADYFFKKAKTLMFKIISLNESDEIMISHPSRASVVNLNEYLFGNEAIKNKSKEIFHTLRSMAQDIPEETIKNFILKKVRSNRDIRLIKEYGSISDTLQNQIPENYLQKLISWKVIMPIRDIKDIFLAELLVTIMYNHSKNMVFIQEAKEFDLVRGSPVDISTCNVDADALSEFRFALCLAKQLDNFIQDVQPKFHSVRYILSKRGGINNFLKSVKSIELIEKVIAESNTMKQDCTRKLYVDFGVLKMCKNYNLYQRCMIQNILRKCNLNLSKLDTSRRAYYIKQTLNHTSEIENILSEMEPWLALTNIHLDIALTYMNVETPQAEKAKHHFNRALAKPGITTRYTLKAYARFIQFCEEQGEETDLEEAEHFVQTLLMQSTKDEQKDFVLKFQERLRKKRGNHIGSYINNPEVGTEENDISEAIYERERTDREPKVDRLTDFKISTVPGHHQEIDADFRRNFRLEYQFIHRINRIERSQKDLVIIERERLQVEREILSISKERLKMENEKRNSIQQWINSFNFPVVLFGFSVVFLYLSLK